MKHETDMKKWESNLSILGYISVNYLQRILVFSERIVKNHQRFLKLYLLNQAINKITQNLGVDIWNLWAAILYNLDATQRH